MKKIKTIILDLGGVILNLNDSLTIKGFEEYGINYQTVSSEFLLDFEKGSISEIEFRNRIQSIAQKKISDFEIDTIWNTMLLDLPAERIELIKKLKRNYKVCLLSNTNSIHIRWFDNYFAEKFKNEKWEKLFNKIFYSFEIGMRKPDREIYSHLLEITQTTGEESVFVDDNVKNLRGAELLGIRTIHAENPLSEFTLEQITKMNKA